MLILWSSPLAECHHFNFIFLSATGLFFFFYDVSCTFLPVDTSKPRTAPIHPVSSLAVNYFLTLVPFITFFFFVVGLSPFFIFLVLFNTSVHILQ